MRIIHPLLFIWWPLLLLGPASAEPSILHETVMGPDGAIWTRTVTSCDASPCPEAESFATEDSREANEYLWLDQNHMSAISEHVAISGDGTYGFVGWWLNNMRTSLYRVAGGTGDPDWSHGMPLAEFQVAVDCDFLGEHLTTTARNESLSVFAAGSPNPIFSDWFSPPYLGRKCGVSDEGGTFAGAGGEESPGVGGELRVYDGTVGVLRFVGPLPAQPEGLCVSGDGQVVAANTRGIVKIWDATSGVLRDSLVISGETQIPIALSGDGSYLVTGGFAKTVRLYRWNGSYYFQVWTHTVPNTTWITALAISSDASTIVAGTWTNPDGGQLVVYDRTSSTPLWTDTSFGDWIQSAAVTPDGGKIAAACWGRLGGTVGNVISVYERSSPIPLWMIGDDAIPGVGSCMSVDLSDNGRFLLAGGKAVHAREFGSGGFVLAMDVISAATAPETADIRPTLLVGPNPFRSTLRFIGPSPLTSIWSLEGRLIRSRLGAEWDGRDNAGREVPAGVYFVRGAGAETPPIRVVRIE